MRAAELLDTFGVNTHVNSAPYDDTLRITAALDYIGFKNIRQSSPIDDGSYSGILALGQAGARIDLIINGGGPVDLAGAMHNVYTLAPYLNAVENVNEAAIFPIGYAGLKGVDAAVALQKDLYTAVRSTPSLDNVPVYSFTIGGADPAAYPAIGDLSAYTDYANIHAYPPQGLRPIFVIHAAIDGGRTDAPSKPVVLTETGFYTLPNGVGWGGIPESLQASYLLDEVLDEAAAGVSRTYLYDLLDDGADPNGTNQEAHFGLFHVDGSAKLSATAFHNLTSILSDGSPAAANFPTSAFSFTATGVPYDYTGNTLLIDKSDGSHVVAVWNEEQLWDTDRLTPIAAQHFPTTVDLHQNYETVLVFDPLVGSVPVQTLHDVSRVDVDLTDHPFLIQVLPNAPTPPPPVVPDPVPTPSEQPVASSPTVTDAVVIRVSEDFYLGDAQFQLTVDGVSVGGIQTASASHAAGHTQEFTLLNPAGLHPAAIGVTFLNDAWGGTPSTDRNLYVDGVSVNGVDVPGSGRALYSEGSTTIGIDGPRLTPVAFDLSEDAWQGDAIALVTIDGEQLGSPVAITAAHASSEVQHLAFLLPLHAGPHTASVTFANDAYGGTSDTDRNLYVDAIRIGTDAVPNAAAALYSSGTVSYATASNPVSDPFTLHAG